MANYNAHTYFGMRVLEELSPAFRRALTEELSVFRTALYGPDPLIFSLRTKRLSDYLHKIWRQETLPELQQAIRLGTAPARCFAAGYLLHQELDDVIHPWIYRWMREGSSHFHMEVELDAIILREQGIDHVPHLYTKDSRRTADAAANFIRPATRAQYLSGLRRMSAFTDSFRLFGPRVCRTITDREKEQAQFLRRSLEDLIPAAAGQLTGLME